MLGLVSLYDSEEHTLINGSGLPEWLNRIVEGDPKRRGHLFLLRYNKLGVFCVCEWTDDYQDTFVDVMNLGKSLGNFTHKKAQELRKLLFAPLTAEETSKAIIRGDSDYYHRLQDEDAEETERQERVAIGE
uniref:Uncharacterized protein n=1 Tax=viral metagenome TaxID=1070528 RepID=A0A6M3JAB9_9ZZZZ